MRPSTDVPWENKNPRSFDESRNNKTLTSKIGPVYGMCNPSDLAIMNETSGKHYVDHTSMPSVMHA